MPLSKVIASLAMPACLVGACASSPASAACPTEAPAEQMTLDYAAFDQAGWRQLLAEGCADAAVATLEQYRARNETVLTPEQTLELHFHMGQALALSGRDAESIPHFERARGGDAEWAAYVGATLALLRHDREALATERQHYAAAARASEMRLAVIDGFIRCADEPYARAVHCGMASMAH